MLCTYIYNIYIYILYIYIYIHTRINIALNICRQNWHHVAGSICRHLLSSWLWRRMFAVTRIVALSLSTIAVDETQEETTLQMLQLDTWTQTCGNTATGKNSLPESYRSVNLPIQAISSNSLEFWDLHQTVLTFFPGESGGCLSIFLLWTLEPLEPLERSLSQLEVQARLCSPVHEHRCLCGLGQCFLAHWINRGLNDLGEGQL